MPRKNQHAVALGRKGGHARAKLPVFELSRMGALGGRPRRYRLTPGPTADVLERLEADGTWRALTPPYDRAAAAALARLLDD